MGNPLFNAFSGNTINPMQMMSQLINNPVQFLASRRLNIPQNISNDPQAIVQHLLNTGQMSQDAYNRFQNQANQLLKNMR